MSDGLRLAAARSILLAAAQQPANHEAQRDAGAKRGKPRGPRGDAQPTHHGGHDANPAAFRSWYVPEGVETGSKVAPPRGQRPGGKPSGPRPQGGSPYGQARGPGGPGGARGPRGPKPAADAPYGHSRGPAGPRGNAPAGASPYGGPKKGPRGPVDGNRGPRPGGNGGPPPFRKKRPEGLPSDD